MAILESTHWRDASRTPRFYFMDAFAALPLLIFCMHIKIWTFLTALAFIAFFVILEKFKFSVPVFFRWFRCTLAGPIRIARPWWRE